jgi:hypothetical protein
LGKKRFRHGREEAIIYRNIAYIQANQLRDMPEALDNIMKAVSADASQPRYFSERISICLMRALRLRQLA